MKQDTCRDVKTVLALAPDTYTDTANGEIVDCEGFGGATLALLVGAATYADGAAFTVGLEHGDTANLSDATAVPNAQVVGMHAAEDLSAYLAYTEAPTAPQVVEIGYLGEKQYLRLTLTKTASPSGVFGAVATLQNPARRPI